jgi:hypothetical protein
MKKIKRQVENIGLGFVLGMLILKVYQMKNGIYLIVNYQIKKMFLNINQKKTDVIILKKKNRK